MGIKEKFAHSNIFLGGKTRCFGHCDELITASVLLAFVGMSKVNRKSKNQKKYDVNECLFSHFTGRFLC